MRAATRRSKLVLEDPNFSPIGEDSIFERVETRSASVANVLADLSCFLAIELPDVLAVHAAESNGIEAQFC